MNKRFVFEIGVEEIPAQYVQIMAESFSDKATEMFEEKLLAFSGLRVEWTPRRLTLIVEKLEGIQADREFEVKGPSKKVAYKEAEPTKALLGFLHKENKTMKDIVLKKIDDIEYVCLQKIEKGVDTADILREELPKLIEHIYLPNAMKWNSFSFKFVRPIRWLLAIFGEKVIKFDIPCCSSSNKTRGHRTLSNKEIVVKNADEYEKKLAENFVILKASERESKILNQIEKLGKEHHFSVRVDKDLLDETVNLVEYPTCGVGSFGEEFLKLPDPIIITPMKEQQRYFAVHKDGKLKNAFVFVRNGDDKGLSQVAHGNERVLNARLKDAEFFYKEDSKHLLKDYDLNTVIYQEQLGTMKDKTNRIQKVAVALNNELKLDIPEEQISEASNLLKSDLLTNVVREFPELQGVVGWIYAKREGYDQAIATAIKEHYEPRFAGDQLPTSLLGAVLSLSDKLDSLVAMFAVGLKPSGSQDPFGLRRQTIGILNILDDKKWFLNLSDFIKSIFSIYERYLKKEEQSALHYISELQTFIEQRMSGILLEERGYAHKYVDDISLNELNISKAVCVIESLQECEESVWYADMRQAFLRIANLLKNKSINSDNVFPKYFVAKEEDVLYKEYSAIKEGVQKQIDTYQYAEALKGLALLSKSIDNYLDNVKVFDASLDIQNNRITLLNNILQLFGRIIKI